MRRALVALVAIPVLALGAGCRGDEAAPVDEQQDGSIIQQFDEVESTLAEIESDVNGD